MIISVTYLALEFAGLERGHEVLDVEEVVPAERALHVVDHALRAGAQDVAELVLGPNSIEKILA